MKIVKVTAFYWVKWEIKVQSYKTCLETFDKLIYPHVFVAQKLIFPSNSNNDGKLVA